MTKVEDFTMTGQHKLWHQEHVFWKEDVVLWEKDLKDIMKILGHVGQTVEAYAQRLNTFNDEINSEEMHMQMHEQLIDAERTNREANYEHGVVGQKHSMQKTEFENLKKIYHQLNLFMTTMDKGIDKIKS